MKYNAFNIIIKYKKTKYNQWYIKSINYKKLIDKIIEDIETQRQYNKNNTINKIIIKCNRKYVNQNLSIIITKNKTIKKIKYLLYSLPIDMLEEANEIYISTKYGSWTIYKTYLVDGKEMNF